MEDFSLLRSIVNQVKAVKEVRVVEKAEEGRRLPVNMALLMEMTILPKRRERFLRHCKVLSKPRICDVMV